MFFFEQPFESSFYLQVWNPAVLLIQGPVKVNQIYTAAVQQHQQHRAQEHNREPPGPEDIGSD